MVFSVEDRLLITICSNARAMEPKKLVKEFSDKGWRVRSVIKLLKRFLEYGTTDRQPGGSRPKIARTAEKI